ncbi:MAG: porphobilinogen synthase [Cytophagales bacterium]|nr:MAG: porphobilinogen synthase [Cytophagales bacterium]TAF61017.1 MAG: porphobilinogen synthase [Cytophagales bacterium]
MQLTRRPRRLRQSVAIRNLVEETQIHTKDLVQPLFLMSGQNTKEDIPSMPNIYRLSLDLLLYEVEDCLKLGIQAFAPFPYLPDHEKDHLATRSVQEDGLYLNAIRMLKQKFPEICLFTDVAMDPYSSDGHDGIVENDEILNDETLVVLGKMALAQAQAGADFVAPSDMMDGRVGYIREVLDQAGYHKVGIMAYTAKYASAFYGPFRDALQSAPKFGDKKTYQMNPANSQEALVEAELDFLEGADMMMVKPALSYLDIIQKLSQNFNIPIAAYNVSGEYAMLKAAAQNKWIDGDRVAHEILLSIKRAGAKVIFTYLAKEFAARS